MNDLSSLCCLAEKSSKLVVNNVSVIRLMRVKSIKLTHFQKTSSYLIYTNPTSIFERNALHYRLAGESVFITGFSPD